MDESRLQIVRDQINMNDKNSDSFTKALLRQIPKAEVVNPPFDPRQPFIIMQPCHESTRALIGEKMDIDKDTTANIIFDIVYDKYRQCDVCIIGNGEVVSKPLQKMFDQSNIYYLVADSSTPKEDLDKMVCFCDIVVIACPPHVKVSQNLAKNVVIDASGTNKQDCIYYYSASDIGRKTVDKIKERLQEA